jgi:hypothetical protein
MIEKIKNISGVWKFLIAVIAVLALIAIISPPLVQESLLTSLSIFKKMLSSLVLAFIFMFVFNIFVTDKVVKKHLKKDIGIKQCLIVAIIGVLSTGPIYMWYAYLSELKDEGVDQGLISIFLYNRAVKLPLLPIMIDYFSLKVTIIITVLIFIFSFINAIFINLFINPRNYENSNRINS